MNPIWLEFSMRQFGWSPRGRHFGLALLVSFALLGGAPGQQLSRDEDEQQFGRMAFQFREKMVTGQEPVPEKTLELASRYYVLRVTSVQAVADNNYMLTKVLKEFEYMAANVVRNSKTNRDVVAKFAPKLIDRFKEVFALKFDPNRVAIVNAALMLPHLATFKNDDVGDYLASLIGDDKIHDAIRVHAAKGMVEYFPAKAFTKFDKGDKATLEKKKRDKDRIDALLKYVNRPMPKPAPTDTLQIEALRYVRREVVTALAATGVPAVTAYKGNLEAPVAAGLVKVLAKKVQPEPSIHERVEAAIGVCQFTKYVDEYDPKIGIYLVGETLSDLFGEYKRDFANISLKGKERRPTYVAWKIQSKRLEYAMKELIENTRGTPSAKTAQDLANLTFPMLKAMANSETLDRDVDFRTAVQGMRPKGKTLFKDEKGSMLDVDWERAAPAEEKEKEEK